MIRETLRDYYGSIKVQRNITFEKYESITEKYASRIEHHINLVCWSAFGIGCIAGSLIVYLVLFVFTNEGFIK